MEVKATLKVINQADCPGRRGVTDGQTYQRMIGCAEIVETDRIRLGRATYKPGTYEQLHWHPIEACYYVISGHATVRNVEGKEFEVGPGSMIYAPPGIAGAHEWEVKESLELLDIRGVHRRLANDDNRLARAGVAIVIGRVDVVDSRRIERRHEVRSGGRRGKVRTRLPVWLRTKIADVAQ